LSSDIAGTVASLTECELGAVGEEPIPPLWLTGTAVGGGQAVGMFSLSR
jgi:hypothetical protein